MSMKRALVTVAASLPLFWGCGEDEAPVPVALVPPTLAIVELKSSADSWKPGDEPAELTLGCDPGRVTGIVVGPSNKKPGQLDDFTLRPPGACGASPQCGALLFTLTGAESQLVRSSSIFAQAELAGRGLDQSYTFRVELRDARDRPFEVRGEVVSAEIHVVLRAPEGCTADADAGADAPNDAELDASDAQADSSQADAAHESSSDAALEAENDVSDGMSGDANVPDAGGG